MRSPTLVQVAVFFAFLQFSALGSDFQSPRTAALGGAGHAGPLLNDAIYMNPSYIPFVPVHGLSAAYGMYNGGQGNTPAGYADIYGHILNISIQDGSPDSLFQAGVGFTVRSVASLFTFGASKSLIQRLGIGVGAKMILPNDGTNNRLWETTIAFSGIATDWFQGSITVDNLLETATSDGFYREFVLGTKVNIKGIVLIYADPHWTPNLPGGQPFGWEAGAEFPVMHDFFLRVGDFQNANISYANTYGNGIGFGAGYVAPKLSIDFGVTRTFVPFINMGYTGGLTVFF